MWVTRTDAPLHGAPNVADGRVFTVTIDDQLLSFDTEKGQPLWNYQAIIEPARLLAAASRRSPATPWSPASARANWWPSARPTAPTCGPRPCRSPTATTPCRKSATSPAVR
ncbi:MAG: PQQ-binding-like beta-propeller repeat protein [Caulobacteraceae bacterium]